MTVYRLIEKNFLYSAKWINPHPPFPLPLPFHAPFSRCWVLVATTATAQRAYTYIYFKMAPLHVETKIQDYIDNIKKYFQENSRTKDFVGHSAKVWNCINFSLMVNIPCICLHWQIEVYWKTRKRSHFDEW